MARKVTIEDIAQLAGVSRTTVSRVLNQRPDVDPETRQRIVRIIEEQGFIPSPTAAGLAGGRSKLIGMLVPTFTWPIIPDLMRGIAEVINGTAYEMVLYSFNDEDLSSDPTALFKRLLAANLTAGMLAIFPGRAAEQLTKFYEQGLPLVIVDDQAEHTTPWVRADNEMGGYLATRHLVTLGHRRIAHIQGPSAYLASHDRYQGYLRALAEADITPDPALVLEGDFLPPSGRECAERLLALLPEQRPTAIFAATDQMAYGVLSAAEAFGIAIPRDVALVGFDDDAPSAHVHPPLTTIRQPSFEMGHHAIELLLSLLETAGDPRFEGSARVRQPQPTTYVQLPTSLIVRASCGARDEHAADATVTTEHRPSPSLSPSPSSLDSSVI